MLRKIKDKGAQILSNIGGLFFAGGKYESAPLGHEDSLMSHNF